MKPVRVSRMIAAHEELKALTAGAATCCVIRHPLGRPGSDHYELIRKDHHA